MLTPVIRDPLPDFEPQKPLVIAHRGASAFAPENTVAAFKLALALRADGVELDVHLSADGHPVVIHDARANRTTNGSGAVSRLTLEQLQGLDAGSWFERKLTRRPRLRAIARRVSAEAGGGFQTFSQETVPTLDAVLKLLVDAGIERIYVELKGNPSSRPALLQAVLSVIRNSGAMGSVTLLSFDHAIVRSAKEIAGDIRTAATFPVKGRRLISTRSIVRAAEQAGVDEVALHFGLATRRAVETFHEHGLSVAVWTANSKLTMRRMVSCGVDAIMTNFPNRLHELLVAPPRYPLSRLRRRRRV